MIDTPTGRPRLFIGSSREGKLVAAAVQQVLAGDIVSEVWSEGIFGLPATAVTSLDRVSRGFDFAALIVTPADFEDTQDVRTLATRDRIIFEAGLFMGRLGKERTFIVSPRDSGIRLPSDLADLPILHYGEDDDRTLEGALAPAAARLRAAIRKFKEYRPVLRPAELVREELDRMLVARPRRSASVGTASAQGPRRSMRIVNISVTGALLESPAELPVGQLLDLDLGLDSGATVRVTAKVVRVQYPDWGRIGGVGVVFTAVAPEARQELEKFVEGESEAA